MSPLLLLFIALPVLEMWVLITVGREIGALPTIGLVILTAVVGLALLRRQGISTLMRAQEKMRSGNIPAKEMVEGIFLAVGGALLLTPGFITDFFGFICLIPGLRNLLLGFLLRHITVIHPESFSQPRPDKKDSDIIEGEYSRHEKRSVEDKRPKP
ncbi:FxsA family protein [Microbulbifer sp. OS29]|uniref:FxsA family protein n=1 Tax=Microbulbifer okhotskensis TaxID=2926617 RepID=A0A9X2EM43_9GAMM|nr:FxsA family protein [Microbulbifer okhotskensis]MCO1334196.1 FxsA family protein [Microbulbifer okhotskensis]